jgi:hypothetical protein
MEPEETSITRQLLGKHVSAKPNNGTIVETVFSVGAVRRLYNKDYRPARITTERVSADGSQMTEMAGKELGCKKNNSCVLQLQWD